jgi:hypothetical protein
MPRIEVHARRTPRQAAEVMAEHLAENLVDLSGRRLGANTGSKLRRDRVERRFHIRPLMVVRKNIPCVSERTRIGEAGGADRRQEAFPAAHGEVDGGRELLVMTHGCRVPCGKGQIMKYEYGLVELGLGVAVQSARAKLNESGEQDFR